MSFFNALQLLTDAAHEYQHERETFSTAEIAGRINEIKYLSSQKKVPKLSLRKEIIHLENKLATVAEVEKRLVKHKKQDSIKEKAMKHRIKELQSRLAAADDKDVQKKLDRVTHLVGDYLAKKATEEGVKAAMAEMESGKKSGEAKLEATAAEKKFSRKTLPTSTSVEDIQPRLQELRQRLQMLKGELELLKILKKDAKAQGVEEKIRGLEEKLRAYAPVGITAALPTEKIETLERPLPAAPIVERKEIKHTILFAPPAVPAEKPFLEKAAPKKSDEDLELEEELPLPPPPKMKKER